MWTAYSSPLLVEPQLGAGEKVYNQSTLILAVLKQWSAEVLTQPFQDCLLSVTLQCMLYTCIEVATTQNIPAAVLRHKTVRNTTAGTRSISTTCKV